MSNPAAFFDTLFLGHKLTDLVQGFSRPELHLLCYAGCLLSLYDGHPSSDWEYEFMSAASGLPFANDVEEVVDYAITLGLIESKGALLIVTAAGKLELDIQRDLEVNQFREEYLCGAADCLLVFSPGNVREAFDYDPTIAYLKNGRKTDWLLGQPDVDRLYANFKELKRILAYDARDLSVPLVTWLKYLIQTGRSLQHGTSAN